MRHTLSCAVLTSLLCAPTFANDTVEARYVSEGLGRYLTLRGSQVGGAFSFTIGQQVIECQNGLGEGAFLNGILATFCTDLEQGDWGGFVPFKVVPLASAPLPGPAMGPAKAQAIADIWAAAAGQQFTSNDHAAALQMLIWDIVYDFDGTQASLDAASGTVWFSDPGSGFLPGVTAIFNSLRSSVGTNAPIGGLRGLTHPDFQDQVVLVPAPGLAGLAVGSVVLAARRRRR